MAIAHYSNEPLLLIMINTKLYYNFSFAFANKVVYIDKTQQDYYFFPQMGSKKQRISCNAAKSSDLVSLMQGCL